MRIESLSHRCLFYRSILIFRFLLLDSSYFDSVRIFTLASSYFPSIYDLENDLTMVTFKEYPEFPSRCSLQTSEDQFYQLRSQHRACRRKNIEKHHLTIETLVGFNNIFFSLS
ncbi:chromatin accessibility complex protein 1 [Sarcoptes scabiei]|nr:chromatin accessibility complex protein 1 [Sarcoptes scabiei]